MESIRRRLKNLGKIFPPIKDTGPERLSAAALTHLSEEELLLLLDVNEKQERYPKRRRFAFSAFCCELPVNLRDQPRRSQPPVALGGVDRNIEDRGRFFYAQSSEVPKFH
jgi:hypothetical protein